MRTLCGSSAVLRRGTGIAGRRKKLGGGTGAAALRPLVGSYPINPPDYESAVQWDALCRIMQRMSKGLGAPPAPPYLPHMGASTSPSLHIAPRVAASSFLLS